ncbi:hypothetical protein RGR602_CH03299 [Rhizobium gallicum bv. gallicum R602sp]|uniref:Uncharacterized protein n=1 Tax=Rhizobium gallicum bv. gallicum R602sp TaxID=1041138 RepID=A0A0B4X7N3_9HYPH|nr:hypothetical protein RGR602_CH03299 [Rhizobium gallicum bv. gallicum R602sp]
MNCSFVLGQPACLTADVVAAACVSAPTIRPLTTWPSSVFANGLAAEPRTPPDVPDEVKEHVKDDVIEGTIFADLGSAGHLQLERTE